MKQLIKINLLLFSLLLTTKAFAVFPNPIGFERWTKSEFTSVEFGQSCKTLQNKFNHKNFFGNIKYNKNKDYDRFYRLTDIEVRKDPNSRTGELIYDAVYVQNTDDFYRKSWLVCDVDRAWLESLISNDKIVLLDVERHMVNQKEHWSAIIQLPPFNVESQILTNMRINDINNYAEEGGWRVLDIDAVYVETPPCDPSAGIFVPDEACAGLKAYYNAVLVRNIGNNYVDWKLNEYLGDEFSGPDYSSPQIPGYWQLVDREAYWGSNQHISETKPTNWKSAMLFVKRGNRYKTWEKQTENKVFLHNVGKSKVIDIESYDDLSASERKWYTVNAELLF